MAIIDKPDLSDALQEADDIDLMLAGANAAVARVAPCLVSTETPPTPNQLAEARLILLGMIKRWVEAGSGAVQSQTAGPFGLVVDTRQKSSGYRPWPSEIKDLQDICRDPAASSKAFAIDTVSSSAIHSETCSLILGAAYCSCGADLAGFPLFGA